ncbi:adhesion G-protein coupled receptor G2-like [Teleopsis dalmanni]|uniref:adhesion G-protein coupled receptor G2-like n=1 Tax=Teleopsis dalmanni TaxID=139649 RepID=UPI0018CF6294|nr:adhesion G-protein coupled receptor G2-like [Teleopsis dalmanni]
MKFQILILFAVISFTSGRKVTIREMQDYNITDFNKTPESRESKEEQIEPLIRKHYWGQFPMEHEPPEPPVLVTENNHKKNTSSLFCEPKKFRHNYLMRGGRVREMLNTWKRGKIGEEVTLHDLCLRENGMPLTLKCLYNNRTSIAEWDSHVNWQSHMLCLRNTSEKIISTELNTLHNEILENKRLHKGKAGRKEVTENVNILLEQPDYKILPADVHFTNKILQAVSAEGADAELTDDVISICNTIMTKDPSILRKTAELNSTNELLETFERYMDSLSSELVPTSRCGIVVTNTTATNSTHIAHHVETIDRAHIGVLAQISTNITVIHINPSCANISGLAIYDYGNSVHPTVPPTILMHNAIGKFRFRFVYLNESANELMHETGLQVATFVPLSLWEYLRTNIVQPNKPATIVLKIYTNDSLFVEQSEVQTQKPFSKILSISIPGYSVTFPEYLPFILRNENYGTATSSNISSNCGYWNYSTWVSQGIVKQTQDKAVILCGTNHLTPFSFLLGGSYRQNDLNGGVLITPANQRALDIITLLGCTLSLLGLLGIWLTAVIFKSWRKLASTKVLLNLCAALTLQMVLFIFVNTDDMAEELVREGSYANCMALGALMQYSILVLFSWMLIIAFLQFQRYVTVIGIERPRHYILKSALAAWGLPIIPTLLVLCIDPHSYVPTAYQLRTDSGVCYPSGHGLHFGVILPVSLIVLANLIIFIYVFYSISHSLNQTLQRQERKMVVKQIRLSILLFFLLGLSWIFGIFTFMKAGIVFAYLFCLTATIQGFILFIYFILLDELPRNAWLNLIFNDRKPKNVVKSTELQSISTNTTGTTSDNQQN